MEPADTGEPTSDITEASPAADRGPDHRLAVYGTLAPGRSNAHELAALTGTWTPATMRGHLHARGGGAASGYPGIVLDEDGAVVEVQLFTSADLPAHWDRLDAFEGPGYRRTLVTLTRDDGPVQAWIYTLAEPVPEVSPAP